VEVKCIFTSILVRLCAAPTKFFQCFVTLNRVFFFVQWEVARILEVKHRNGSRRSRTLWSEIFIGAMFEKCATHPTTVFQCPSPTLSGTVYQQWAPLKSLTMFTKFFCLPTSKAQSAWNLFYPSVSCCYAWVRRFVCAIKFLQVFQGLPSSFEVQFNWVTIMNTLLAFTYFCVAISFNNCLKHNNRMLTVVTF